MATKTRRITLDGPVEPRAPRARSERGMPLRGHRYHTLTDDSLHFIIKDAGEAAVLAKGMQNLDAEGKYLDQMNDARTVLFYRRTRDARRRAR